MLTAITPTNLDVLDVYEDSGHILPVSFL